MVSSSLAKKEVAPIFYMSAIALAVLVIVAPANMKWFALSAFVALAMSVVSGLILVPSLYIPVKAKADSKPKAGYVGAKKTSTKEKKVFNKVAAPVVEEAPVEETEEVVEDVVEELVDETEEVVDEAPVEEVVEENNDQE